MPRHLTLGTQQSMAPRALTLRLNAVVVHQNLRALAVGAPDSLRSKNRRLCHRLLPPVQNLGRNMRPQPTRLDHVGAALVGARDADNVVSELVFDMLRYADDAEGMRAALELEHVGILLVVVGADVA